MFTTRVLAIVAVVFAAVVLAKPSTVPGASTVPGKQDATLAPGQSVQFRTSTSGAQTLTITNTSVQSVAAVQINCSSWERPSMGIAIEPFKSYSHTAIFGGAPMLIINTTNPNNPARINTMLSTVGG